MIPLLYVPRLRPRPPPPPPVRLIGPDYLHEAADFRRAQQLGASTGIGPDGTWRQFGADVPRFVGPRRRLLIEGQRSNVHRNPRGEGGEIGGALPSSWTSSGPGGTATLVGRGVEDGIPFCDVRFTGTLTSGYFTFGMSPTGDRPPAVPGQSWVVTRFVRALTPLASVTRIRQYVRQFTPAGMPNTDLTVDHDIPRDGTLGSPAARLVSAVVIDNPDVLNIGEFVQINTPNGTEVDETLRIGWSMFEQSFVPTTPALPPEGAPQSITRGADLLTFPAAQLFPRGECTILWSGVFPAFGADSQYIWQLDSGLNANRYYLFSPASGQAIRMGIGNPVLTTFVGSAAPGQQVAFAATIKGGRFACMMRGGALATISEGPDFSLMSTLRVGNGAASTVPMQGETEVIDVLPYAAADEDLPALLAALP